MKGAVWFASTLVLFGGGGAAALAHFSMLLPQAASAQRAQTVLVVFQWGHPFEHELFDAPPPQGAFVLTPDQRQIGLEKALKKITVQYGEKKAVAYQVRFTPQERGDYTFVLINPPMWMEEYQEFWQDTARVTLHVQTQNGWDARTGQTFDMVPLTRPYGLQPGMVFQAQAFGNGKPLAGCLVEVERYNPAAPKELPPDEQITRSAKSDPNGVVTCTLTEPGWWCLTSQQQSGKVERDGKAYPVRRRASLWVFVDEKVPDKTAK
jgi:cobalt/nickel transport protein